MEKFLNTSATNYFLEEMIKENWGQIPIKFHICSLVQYESYATCRHPLAVGLTKWIAPANSESS